MLLPLTKEIFSERGMRLMDSGPSKVAIHGQWGELLGFRLCACRYSAVRPLRILSFISGGLAMMKLAVWSCAAIKIIKADRFGTAAAIQG
jgi:hypothetical protein